MEEVMKQFKPLFVLLEEHSQREQETFAILIYYALQYMGKVFLLEDLDSFAKSSSLSDDVPQSSQIILLLNILHLFVGVIDVLLAISHPVLNLDLLILSEDDTRGSDSPVNDALLVEELKAIKDGKEGMDDFCLLKWEEGMSPPTILQFSFESGESAGVEESVVVDDGSDECGVIDVLEEGGVMEGLQILVGFLGRFVQKQDVIGLEPDDGELLVVCSIVHFRNYLVYYFFHQFLFLNAAQKSQPKGSKYNILIISIQSTLINWIADVLMEYFYKNGAVQLGSDQYKPNIQLNRQMKAISIGQQLEEFHQKCVCQICSCQKHRCPHSKIHIPHQEISSYQKQFIKHPINTWKKPPPEKAKAYRPYDYINSKYREDYPGHKPQMREKLVPRVKDEKKDFNFNSTSEYFNQFGPKKVPKTDIFIKDNQFVPDKQPFNGSTSYGAEFGRKFPNPHNKEAPADVKYPNGYKFNPATTYGSDFFQKSSSVPKNYKPEERLANKGPHDLSTIYRDDFKEKPQPHICPILKMPRAPHSMCHPSQHLTYNKFSGSWLEK